MNEQELLRINEAIDFPWFVSEGGYILTNRRLFPADLTRRRLVYPPFGKPELLGMRPIKKRIPLYEIFRAVEPTKEGIESFANNYGALQTKCNDWFEVGEPLSLWISEIEAMNEASKLKEELDRSSKSRRRRENVSEERLKEMKERLLSLVNEHLQGRISAKILNDKGRLGLYFRPESLVGALWLLFANAIDSGCQWRRCGCGALFEVARSKWAGTGGRTDRFYCSTACRMKAYRVRLSRLKTHRKKV